jgi:hypothetical protein
MRRSVVRSLCFLSLFSFFLCGIASAGTLGTWSTGSGPAANAVLELSSDGDDLDVSGNVMVEGDVVVTNPSPGTTLNVDIGATTHIYPATVGASTAAYGQLIFHALKDAKILVNVDYDLFFTGTNFTEGHASNQDLIVTFSGDGQTEFRMANGKTVGFEGFWPDNPGEDDTFVDDYMYRGAGTKALVTMDQTYQDAAVRGINKVVFARKYYNQGIDDTTKVSIGRDSFFTYVSDDTDGIIDSIITDSACAAVAFDVSNSGSGRMLLHLKGSYTVDSDGTIPDTYSEYNDAGFVIAGHKVANLTTASSFRDDSDFNTRTGGQAFFRVVDEKAYDNSTYAATLGSSESTLNSLPTRRGLLVVNENKSVAKFAADPYGDNAWYTYNHTYGADKGNSRIPHGFVLGVNGVMEVFHNTFFDYVAASTMRMMPHDLANDDKVKKHNPSAFVVDGIIDTYEQSFTSTLSEYGGQHAEIILRGDAKMHFRSGVNSLGYVDWSKYRHLGSTGDYVYSFTIGNGLYDGDKMTSLSSLSSNLDNLTEGEGNHVVDVEGKVSIFGTSDNNSWRMDGMVTATNYMHFGEADWSSGGAINGHTFARHQIVADANNYAMINVAPLKLDPAGREITTDDNSGTYLAEHPLTECTTGRTQQYPCYNSSSIFLNADMKLHNLRFEHDDVLKTVGASYLTAEPAIVGGEKRVFNSDTTTYNLPQVHLYTTTVVLHEGLASSGVRFVVTDRRDFTSTSTAVEHNYSTLRYYNHGDRLDMQERGYGRIFQLGTQSWKTLVDGSTTSDLLQDAYVNVYRSWKDTSADKNVELILTTALQPKYIGPYYETGNVLTYLNTLDNDNRGKATQLFYLCNGSNMSLGWTTTAGDEPLDSDTESYYYGANEDDRAYPWSGVLGTNTYHYSLSDTACNRARLHVAGDYFYFGGITASGAVPSEPVDSTTFADRDSAVIYVDHGGQLTSADDVDCFVDTIVAAKAWPQVLHSGAWTQAFAGKVDVPQDQTKFGRSIQPYGLDYGSMFDSSDDETKDANLRLGVYYHGTTSGGVERAKASGEEVTIGWHHRDDINRNGGTSYLEPVRAFDPFGITRSTASPTAYSDTLSHLVTVSSGDLITQMRVSGATQADPFHLYVTGDGDSYGFVRELTSLDCNDFVPGAGQCANIIIDHSGHLGLGTRHWNEHSNKAWNLLGQDYVTLVPNGNGLIHVNSDLIIVDRWAMVPASDFGSSEAQKLTFFSEKPVEIRVPMGSEFDLSAFSSSNQRIEFAGKVKLIIESGASIRFPETPGSAPILYFNDDAQLIFEEHNHQDETTWTTYYGSEYVRSKIYGVGQIWLNKNARCHVNGNSFVGVQTDGTTGTTNLTISIQREGAMYIGTPDVAGGVFQVGNPTDTSGTVSFTLTLNGERSLFHIDREGFFGLGSGLRNKTGVPNGNWRSHKLYDVATVSVNVTKGIFDHNQIFDGSSRFASVMGIGPVSSAYNFSVGEDGYGVVRGGGNLLYTGTTLPSDAYPISILDTAVSTTGSAIASIDDGSYSILASDPIMRQRPSAKENELTSTNLTALTPDASLATSASAITFSSGNAVLFFNFLHYLKYSSLEHKYVCFHTAADDIHVGYVFDTTITRSTDFYVRDNEGHSVQAALGEHRGTLGATGNNSSGNYPQKFSLFSKR